MHHNPEAEGVILDEPASALDRSVQGPAMVFN
jgi:ABC-type microcin C transport system duplicated ATPase subunit YejF